MEVEPKVLLGLDGRLLWRGRDAYWLDNRRPIVLPGDILFDWNGLINTRESQTDDETSKADINMM